MRAFQICYNESMKHKSFLTAIILVGCAILLGMLFFTSPTDIGPAGVLVFFTTVYIVTFGLITKLMQLFYRLAFKREHFRSKDYLYSAVLAAAPSLLLIACSFGSITPWVCLLIGIFVFLFEFLIAKRA